MNDTVKTGERIAKIMARAGLCSRRDAERWIADGRVSVNGKVITSPALNIGEDDEVYVDGDPLPGAEKTRLFRFCKPAGLITTDRDPKGRPTIYSILPRSLPRVMAIGRLDIATEGLLMLTNDGELARYFELPASGWQRRYRARIFGKPTQADLDKLAKGIKVDGVKYGPVTATIDKQQGANCWVNVTLAEGKNREVRKVMEYLGFTVNRLIRVSYGPFQLGNLEEGRVEEVTGKVMREQFPEFFKDTKPAKKGD